MERRGGVDRREGEAGTSAIFEAAANKPIVKHTRFEFVGT